MTLQLSVKPKSMFDAKMWEFLLQQHVFSNVTLRVFCYSSCLLAKNKKYTDCLSNLTKNQFVRKIERNPQLQKKDITLLHNYAITTT